MNKKLMVLLVAFSFSFAACGTPEDDMNNFCEIVGEVMADKSKKGEKRDIAIMKKVSMSLKTDEGKEILMGLSKVKPKKRYKALKKGAKKLGMKGYKCKAAKKWFKSQKK